MKKNDYIILERLVEQYGPEEVLNELEIPKSLVKRIAKGALATSLAIGGYNAVDNIFNNDQIRAEQQIEKKRNNPFGFSDNEYALYLDRVAAVKKEIERIFNIRGISMEELRFSPEHVVYLCHKYDFDLPLLIAQARNESAFGTTKRAKKCNTMFSLGQYDNGKNMCTFDTFDEGTEAYIRTVKKYYLLDGEKTVDELLKDKCYVDYKGDRYASNRHYERELRNIRNSIIHMYPVLSNDIDPDTYNGEYTEKSEI